MEEMRRGMLAQILDGSARERRMFLEITQYNILIIFIVNRISIVKPERARAIEDLIIRMARAGQLQGKLNEQGVIDLLEQIRGSEEQQQPKIVINRRRFDDDEDEDDYDFS